MASRKEDILSQRELETVAEIEIEIEIAAGWNSTHQLGILSQVISTGHSGLTCWWRRRSRSTSRNRTGRKIGIQSINMPFAWIQFLKKHGFFNIFTGDYTIKFNVIINFPSKETNFLAWNQARISRSWIIWSKLQILSPDTFDGKRNWYWEQQSWYQAYKQWRESYLA